MWAMAVRTVFRDIGMFVNERPLVLHVATSAEGFGGDALDVLLVGREMWIVTVGTDHLVFWDRVMGELGELHFDLRVAAGTELFLLVTSDFLLRADVQLMAVKAAYIIQCMHA